MKKHAALNRIYRLVWSHARQALVAVAETAKGRGKQGTRRKLLLALALTPPLALGAPIGGEVIAGSGRITQQVATTREKSNISVCNRHIQDGLKRSPELGQAVIGKAITAQTLRGTISAGTSTRPATDAKHLAADRLR